MRSHDYCFYGGCAFLIGVSSALLGVPSFFVTCGTIICTIGCFVHAYITQEKWIRSLGICFLCIIIGFLFVSIRYERFVSVSVPYNTPIEFTGCVSSEVKTSGVSNEMKLQIQSPFVGAVNAKMRVGEPISYGDCVRGTGVVAPPTEKQKMYFLKEHVYGTIAYPKISKLSIRDESFIKKGIFSMREQIIYTFKKILPRDEAVFLAGLTIGAKGEFPQDLQTAMKKSGTTHLVALSGYNIMIVINVLMLVFAYVMKKRYAIMLTGFCIVLFSLFAGAESSLVRAALLGSISIIAGLVGRSFDIRQAVILAAVAMTVVNPFVLIFDVGFQLSFAAFLGIAYCSPALMEFFHISEKHKVLKVLIDSFSAQLATLPIIALQFGVISVVGVISSVILLEFVPITMAFGFFGAFLSFVSSFLASIPLLFAGIFLKFELWVIRLFGMVEFVEFNTHIFFFVIYYAVLIIFVSIYLKRRDARNRILILREP
jgi:competence protein ComEC